MKLIKLVLIVVLLVAPTHSVKAQGVSYLGLCNRTWNCEKTLASWYTTPIVTGWLEDSFGSKCECADTILAQRRHKTIRVHLANGPCLRNNRCERHDVFWGYTIASANRAAKIPRSRLRKRLDILANRLKQRIEQSKGSLTCYVSPCLECDLDGKARNALISAVSATLPSCSIVDNPLRGACLPGRVCERHGTSPNLARPCIADLDGTQVNSIVDLQRYYANTKDCDVRYYWSAWMNCNYGAWRYPSRRDCRRSIYKYYNAGRLAWNLLSSQ